MWSWRIGQELGRRWTAYETNAAISMIVKEHGGPPGEKCAELGEQRLLRIIGMLVAGMPSPAWHRLFRQLDKVAREGVCPVMVGLIGAASSGAADRFSCAWPLSWPLAPYFEAVADAPAAGRV